ncbi:hypothetical protein HPB47_014578 [Ixodes persulcatus]|uniref:Uncharacterized protein n=1 Tax=Ixodes persulcatus TaxID=34615 RepID=A0AC60QVS7_IXOPE|nr:hypothetical protein HPB47_014578 [Ixodes persulcatus]
MSHVVSGTTATQWAAEDPLPALATPPDQQPGCGYNDGYGAQTNEDQDRNEGSLLIVYGLNSNKKNAEKLFNLLCLYGKVVNFTEEQERLCHGADGGPPGQAESSVWC